MNPVTKANWFRVLAIVFLGSVIVLMYKYKIPEENIILFLGSAFAAGFIFFSIRGIITQRFYAYLLLGMRNYWLLSLVFPKKVPTTLTGKKAVIASIVSLTLTLITLSAILFIYFKYPHILRDWMSRTPRTR